MPVRWPSRTGKATRNRLGSTLPCLTAARLGLQCLRLPCLRLRSLTLQSLRLRCLTLSCLRLLRTCLEVPCLTMPRLRPLHCLRATESWAHACSGACSAGPKETVECMGCVSGNAARQRKSQSNACFGNAPWQRKCHACSRPQRRRVLPGLVLPACASRAERTIGSARPCHVRLALTRLWSFHHDNALRIRNTHSIGFP